MKRFAFFLLSFFALTSCSQDDSREENPIISDKLVRVDFRPGLNGERRWHFNSEGLLTSITKADGTIVESFLYDANDNLVQNTKLQDNGTYQTYNITYAGGLVFQINAQDYNYSYLEHKYFYTSGFESFECTVDENDIIENSRSVYDDNVDVYETNYNINFNDDGNLISHFFHGTLIGDYEHSFTYNLRTNPIRSGVLSILRAKSLYDPYFFTDGHSSANLMMTMNYATDDFESNTYTYDYNTNNLPVTQTQSHFNGGVLQNTYVTAKYYYEGDVLP